MSANEKQNLNETDFESNEEQAANLEVETATSDNTVMVAHESSRIPNRNLQQPIAKGTEVHPNDVIIVEQLSHESLGKSSSENLECKVTYEFPSEDESQNVSFTDKKECKVTSEYLNGPKVSRLSEAYRIPEVCHRAEHFSVSQITHAKILNPKALNEESSDDTGTVGTSSESERKRKKGSISLVQSKKYKDVGSSNTPVAHSVCNSGYIRQDENSSDEFADVEDNIKESLSSENSDSNATTETEKQVPTKNFDANIPQKNGRRKESLGENKSLKENYGAPSSNLNNSLNKKSAMQSPFPSLLKGETIPAIKLSDDMKKKFEISMPTILEVKESESDEQILQPKKSNSNPFVMKSSVVKRKDKCNICNARLGLCAIKCRCGGYYCAKHRYDKEHNCTFDYKSMGAAEIEKNNPRIVAEKVRKL